MHNLIVWVLLIGFLAAPVLAQRESASPLIQPPLDIRRHGFIYCISGIVDTFNPQIASHNSLTVNTLAPQLYDSLLGVDPDAYQLTPQLAESWEVLNNGMTYRFHLRKNIPFQSTEWFSPTRTMNADDVMFSFQRIFNPKHPYHYVNGGRYPYFDSLQFKDTVQSIKKLNEYTIDFHLNAPDASFLWYFITYNAPILSAEYADMLAREGKQEQIDRKPVGTGPFVLNEYFLGQYIRLSRNDLYWKGLPGMPQMVIDLNAGGTGRLSKLITGECDVLAHPTTSQLSIFRNDPRLRLTLRSGMNMAYLAFNTRKPPLDDRRVRHAIALSINNQQLAQFIYYGTAEAAASVLPRASWAYDNQAQVTEYNPAKAKEMLRQLGITKLELNFWVPAASQSYNPSPLKTAVLIQTDLARIGIKVNIVPINGRFQQVQLTKMKYDMVLSGWFSDSNEPDNFLRPLLSCAAMGSDTNYAHWCDTKFDEILQKALRSQQLTQRIAYYQQAQKILREQLPLLPLASSLRLQAYRYDIKGLVLSPFGSSSFAGVFRDSEEGTKQ